MVARCSKSDFRNLGIIWDRNMIRKKMSEIFFVEKKQQNVEKMFVDNFFVNQNFDRFFLDQQFLIENLIKFSIKNRSIFRSKFWSTKIFDIFFLNNFFETNRQKFSDEKIPDHLFRSQMIPRFWKSHLVQCAAVIKIRIACTKKTELFCVFLAQEVPT